MSNIHSDTRVAGGACGCDGGVEQCRLIDLKTAISELNCGCGSGRGKLVVICDFDRIICCIYIGTLSMLWERYKMHHGRLDRCRQTTLCATPICDQNEVRNTQWRSNVFMDVVRFSLVNEMENSQFISFNFEGKKELMELWKRTSGIEVDLFGDLFHTDGVVEHFYSMNKHDVYFGGRGAWDSAVEDDIEAACATPPQGSESSLQQILYTFERNVCRMKPYCRTAVFPLDKKYGIDDIVNRGMFGCLLVEMDAPERFERLSDVSGHVMPKMSNNRLGLFIWNNHSHLVKHKAPNNIEQLYLRWVKRHVTTFNRVKVYWEGFERAFPKELRGDDDGERVRT